MGVKLMKCLQTVADQTTDTQYLSATNLYGYF